MRLILVLIATALLCSSCVSKKTAQSDNEVTSIDTLIIRNICGYCNTKRSTSKQNRKDLNTLCVCFDMYYPDTFGLTTFKSKLENATTAKHIVMENPSLYINYLPFKRFSNLKSLYLFGNDYNMDGLKSFPKGLLEISSLKSITFEGVRFDKEELERIKQNYPHINIIGKIDDY